MFEIIVTIPAWTTSTLRRGGKMSFLTSPRRTKIRPVCPRSFLCRRFRRGWSALLLQSLHLCMKLGSELFILIGELSNPILRDPIIPAEQHHVVVSSRHFLRTQKYRGRKVSWKLRHAEYVSVTAFSFPFTKDRLPSMKIREGALWETWDGFLLNFTRLTYVFFHPL